MTCWSSWFLFVFQFKILIDKFSELDWAEMTNRNSWSDNQCYFFKECNFVGKHIYHCLYVVFVRRSFKHPAWLLTISYLLKLFFRVTVNSLKCQECIPWMLFWYVFHFEWYVLLDKIKWNWRMKRNTNILFFSMVCFCLVYYFFSKLVPLFPETCQIIEKTMDKHNG